MASPTLFWLKRIFLEMCLYLIVFVGIGMRLDYFGNKVFRTYHADALSVRLAYIQEVCDNGVPRRPVLKDIYLPEFSEQPLYYLLASKIVTPHKDPTFSVSVFRLAMFSTALSIGALIFVLFASFYASSRLVRYGIVVITAFAPFYLIHTSDIGDDNLVLFASSGFFYFVMRLNRSAAKSGIFWWVLLFLGMSLFSKLSSVVLLLALPWIYWRSTRNGTDVSSLSNRLGMAGFVLGFWLFFTFFHAWDHDHKVFTFIDPLPLSFDQLKLSVTEATFCMTHYSQLIADGAATLDPEKYSYWTTLYGRFFVGTWDYKVLIYSPLAVNQIILLVGLMLPVGLLLSLGNLLWKRRSFMNTTALGLVLTGLGLHMIFVFWFPLSQSGDPIYLYPILPWLLFMGWRGLTIFRRNRYVNFLAWCGTFLLTFAFVIADIIILTSNNSTN